MQAVEQAVRAYEIGTGAWFANPDGRTPAVDLFGALAGPGRLIEEARWRLLRAGKGSAHAAADLDALKPALAAAADRGDPYACEVLAAMCARGAGTPRSAEEARQWTVRAVDLLHGKVERPAAGRSGFLLSPTDKPEHAYRPLYTKGGVLVTNEIGTASTHEGRVCFDRWGRPELNESRDPCGGPTRASPRSVAARIARESTLEDFAWACQRTTPEFRAALIDARVIAHGRMQFQRCRRRPLARMPQAA
jgi:hypothetical protein